MVLLMTLNKRLLLVGMGVLAIAPLLLNASVRLDVSESLTHY